MNVTSDEAGTALSAQELRHVYGAFATGVTVVTVGGPTPHGMTANSFTSVSLDPPVISVCVGRDAIMHAALVQNRQFGVSVLASDQEDVARHFADQRRPLGKEQFDYADWLSGPATGSPLLVGAAAHFECDLWRAYDGGDHTIFLGRLLTLERLVDDDALLFLCGKFHQVARERTAVTP